MEDYLVMAIVYIGVGTNLGNKEENIRRSIARIAEIKDTRVIKVSSFHKTRPWGYRHQPDFLNAALKIKTEIGPQELFKTLKKIEKKLGRRKLKVKWGPRLIDLDILLYNHRVIDEGNLKIPHPEMHKRDFVLTPLEEIAAQARHPVLGKTIRQLNRDGHQSKKGRR